MVCGWQKPPVGSGALICLAPLSFALTTSAALTKLEQYRQIREALPGVPILANVRLRPFVHYRPPHMHPPGRARHRLTPADALRSRR